jgi:hypothetical protein
MIAKDRTDALGRTPIYIQTSLSRRGKDKKDALFQKRAPICGER